MKLDCMWIGAALQPDVDVTGEHTWFDVCREAIQYVSQLREETGSYS